MAAVDRWLGTKFKEGYPDFEVGLRGVQAQTRVAAARMTAVLARRTQAGCALIHILFIGLGRCAGVPEHVDEGDTGNGSGRSSTRSSGSRRSTSSSSMNMVCVAIYACGQHEQDALLHAGGADKQALGGPGCVGLLFCSSQAGAGALASELARAPAVLQSEAAAQQARC